MPTLSEMALERFGGYLMPAEEKILEGATTGGPADLTTGDGNRDAAADADKWDISRSVRAEFLSWLCTAPETQPFIHSHGVQAIGINVLGRLDLLNADVPRAIALYRCAIDGGIDLLDATTTSLLLSGSQIGHIRGDGLTCKGNIFLNQVTVNGEVRLLGAQIGASLYCDCATLTGEGEIALNADRLSCKESVFLRQATVNGEARFLGANIGGDLTCNSTTFKSKGIHALSADRLTCKGNIFLNQVAVNGEVRFVGADIGGDLSCVGATFESPQGDSIMLQGAHISGGWFLRETKIYVGNLNLKRAVVTTLVDDVGSWPTQGHIFLDAFEYGSFVGDTTPVDAKTRLLWIAKQPTMPFRPQPYEQLAKVLKNMGHESDAREVQVAKQWDRLRYGRLKWPTKIWTTLLGLTIGFGYKRARVLLWIFAVILAGTLIFGAANVNGIMVHSEATFTGYPIFNSVIYSTELFIPFMDLHLQHYWLANATAPGWEWIRWYTIFHIMSGWLLSSLAAASLTGLLRSD